MNLTIEKLSKRYGRSAPMSLDQVTLKLTPGIVGLLGPNGAGKSTMMNIIATLMKPTNGRILWNGEDVARNPNQLRQQLGYLPQDFGVYPNLNAVEFLQYMAALKGVPSKPAQQRIAELLHLLNLETAAYRPIGGYSGGMRQRVGIAQALINDPKLLIVDEPTVGLDPGERVRFRNLLADLASDRIIILSTHIVSDVEATASSIALINQGRLIRHDLPERLLTSVEGRVWDWVIDHDALTAVKQKHLVSQSIRRSDGLHVRVVQEQSPSRDAIPASPTLEDAYLNSIFSTP
ncbi:MAG: ABC transporter ATP-binding protein [Chloroflexota bacterium]